MSTTVDLGKITASVTVGNTTTGAAGTNASVSNSGTTQDAVLNFTIPRGAQGVQGPQGSTGPQGPAGPTGPQGPMGDVAVITPEQQAAFTMYSEPGQHTNGPMTQKAVTDALVAGSISYDNSQSGLAAENVQGALDEVTQSVEDIEHEIQGTYFSGDVISYLDYQQYNCFCGSNVWVNYPNCRSIFIPVGNMTSVKITANPNYNAVYFFTTDVYHNGDNAPAFADGETSMHAIEPEQAETINNIPGNAVYLCIALYPSSGKNFIPSEIKVITVVSRLDKDFARNSIEEVAEDGFFVIDKDLNIGFKVDSDGIEAKNSLHYDIIEY